MPAWLLYLITDQAMLGAVTWVGTLATIIGFVIALMQLSRIKRASEAAKDAAILTTRKVKTREQSNRLSNTLAQLRSAMGYIRHENPEAAGAYLEIGCSYLIEARELTPIKLDQEKMTEHLSSIRRVLDQIRESRHNNTSALMQTSYETQMQAVLTWIEEVVARLHFQFEETDVAQ